MIWVKGHASNAGNNRCDELATAASADKNKVNWAIDLVYENLSK
jgi:ribonuclease HI